MKPNPGYHFIFVLNSIFYLTVVQSEKHSFSLTEVKNPHEYQWRLLESKEVWGPQLCSAHCANNINCDAYTIAETESPLKSANNNHWGNNKYTCQLRQISSEADSPNEETIGTTFQVNRGSTKLISKIQATTSEQNKDIANSATTNHGITETRGTTTITSSVTNKSVPNTSTTMPSTGCLPCNVGSAFYDDSKKNPVVICDSNDIYTLNTKDLCSFSEKSSIASKLENYEGKAITVAVNLKGNVVAFQDEGGDWYFYTYTSKAPNSIAKNVIVPEDIENNIYHFATNINDKQIILVGENNTYDCVRIDDFYHVPSKGSKEKKSKEEKPKNNKKNGKGTQKNQKCKNKNKSCEKNNSGENQENHSAEKATQECDKAMDKLSDTTAGERIGDSYYLFHGNNVTTIAVK